MELFKLLTGIVYYARPGASDVPSYVGSGSPGATDSADFAANDQIINLGTDIHKFGRRKTPLLSYIMGGVQTKPTVQETFGHLEQPHNPEFVEYTGADETVQGNTITIANYARLSAGQVIYWIRAKRATRVATTPGGTGVSIAGTQNLNFGTPGTPLLKNGDKGILLPRHVAEGSQIGDFVEYGRVQYDFQTSIVEEPVTVTGTRGAQRLRSRKGVWQDAFDEASDAFNRKLQAGLVLQGGFAPTTPSGEAHPIHASMSIDAFTTQHRWVFGRRINKFDFEEILLALGRENKFESGGLAVICGRRLKSTISGWASKFLEFTPEEAATLGVEVKKLLMGTGDELTIIPLDFFDKDPTLEGRFWIFDRGNMLHRPLIDVDDRSIKYYPNPLADPGNTDTKGGRIFGEFGFEFFNPESFASGEDVRF